MSKNAITSKQSASLSEPHAAQETAVINSYDIAYHRARAARLRNQAIVDLVHQAKAGFASTCVQLLTAVQDCRRSQPPQNQLAYVANNKRKSEAQVIAELNAYSDKELAELGIARSAIAETVRRGRPGFPEQSRHQAA